MVRTPTGEQGFGGNKLLAALPDDELDGLRGQLEIVSLKYKEVIIEPGEPIEHVYFPLGCVVSVITGMDDGRMVEVGTIGNEGMAGLPVFLGKKTIRLGFLCQVAGAAARMRAEDLRNSIGPNDKLRNLLQAFTEATFVFAAQSSACNRLHSVEQRASRWLLHTHDRVDGDEFPLTHEFLSQMLGVRRASVSEVASRLQKAGLISYERGNVAILDRSGLETKSCECYRIIEEEFDSLLD